MAEAAVRTGLLVSQTHAERKAEGSGKLGTSIAGPGYRAGDDAGRLSLA